jgi:hypothetical protein
MVRFGESRFAGRDIVQKPTCPFCTRPVDRPEENAQDREMPVGSCACGAVFSCDVTGHNLGSALIEALVFACQGNWDAAWDLVPEDDYLEQQVTNYDYETHMIIQGGAYRGRRIAGTLYFIRLHKNIREKEKQLPPAKQADTVRSPGKPSAPPKKLTKKDVESLVQAYDLAPLLAMAEEDNRIIRDLKRLLYSGDKQLRWRAAEALGKVASVVSLRDHGTVARLLQGFFTALTDTASSSWGAMDAIGEIIGNQPERFSGFLPQIFQFSRDRALLPDILRALCRIGSENPDLLRSTSFRVSALLQDPDPSVRGHAAIFLGRVAGPEAKDDLERLLGDPSEVEIYNNGFLERKTVGQVAAESLKKR